MLHSFKWTINRIIYWTKKWRIKTKLVNVSFTNKQRQHLAVGINDTFIPYANSEKYLSTTLNMLAPFEIPCRKDT